MVAFVCVTHILPTSTHPDQALTLAMTWSRHQTENISCYWPFVWPVNSPLKGQWRGDLMFSLICAWINGYVNIREAGDLRRHRAHYDVTVMNYFIGCDARIYAWNWLCKADMFFLWAIYNFKYQHRLNVDTFYSLLFNVTIIHVISNPCTL